MFKTALLSAVLFLPRAAVCAPPPATEYKVLADQASVPEIKKTFGLAGRGKVLQVYFYDTAGLDLYGRGRVLRARAGAKNGDITVKMRPAPAVIPPEVLAAPNFKCEFDRTAGASVYACSLSREKTAAQIAAAARGGLKLEKLFKRKQEAWLGDLDWRNLLVLGPVKSESWQANRPGLGELAFESWTLPGGPSFFEISFRATGAPEAAEEKIKAFHKELERLGVKLAADQSSKTYAAMAFFAKK
jgi:hypothetical protein